MDLNGKVDLKWVSMNDALPEIGKCIFILSGTRETIDPNYEDEPDIRIGTWDGNVFRSYQIQDQYASYWMEIPKELIKE